MEKENVYAVYFSPTGNTRRIAEAAAAAAAAGGAQVRVIDFTMPADRDRVCAFKASDLVFFGMPVYAGRLPNKLLEFLAIGFAGKGARAAAVVTFGNRGFDSALLELYDSLTGNGFEVCSAAAFACGHAFSDTVAAGRPDESDLMQVWGFGRRTLKNAEEGRMLPRNALGSEVGPYYTPLGTDGEPKQFLKAKPVTDERKCTRCGLCARMCPMGSIEMNDCSLVSGVCIKCHACISSCPEHAKRFADEAFLSHKAMLEMSLVRRKNNSVFV